MSLTKAQMAELMEVVFSQLRDTREAGQKEYAHREENAFANFERVAERLGITREQVLMVYMEKHIDGIHSYVNGYRSQREDVRGRIKDVIVYSILLWGMVEDGQKLQSARASTTPSPHSHEVAAVEDRTVGKEV